MFSYIPHELKLIQFLLDFRIEVLNPFFIFLNHLDTGLFYCMVAIFCFTCLNPRVGLRCFVVLAVLVASNYFFKNLLQQPRPLILDPSLGLIQTNSLYGLPSGGAQGAMMLALFFLHYFRHQTPKLLAIGYVILICISRVYLGMHFISDVIAGCLIGYLLTKPTLAMIDSSLVQRIQLKAWLVYLASAASLLIATQILQASAYQYALSFIIGVCCSACWLDKTPAKDHILHPIAKMIFFVMAMLVFYLFYTYQSQVPYGKLILMPTLMHILLFLYYQLMLPVHGRIASITAS